MGLRFRNKSLGSVQLPSSPPSNFRRVPSPPVVLRSADRVSASAENDANAVNVGERSRVVALLNSLQVGFS